MPKMPLILLLALALGACDARTPDADAPANDALPANAIEDATGPEDDGRAALPPETPAVSPADSAIPAAFHGRWGMVPADCGPDASIAKGLMTVNGAMLRFYESVGRPVTIDTPAPDRLSGRFGFTGEGMEWSKDITLTLADNGNAIIRTESDPDTQYRYARCPA